jgi:hypothetical protein
MMCFARGRRSAAKSERLPEVRHASPLSPLLNATLSEKELKSNLTRAFELLNESEEWAASAAQHCRDRGDVR